LSGCFFFPHGGGWHHDRYDDHGGPGYNQHR
jgi:hypothetical protein